MGGGGGGIILIWSDLSYGNNSRGWLVLVAPKSDLGEGGGALNRSKTKGQRHRNSVRSDSNLMLKILLLRVHTATFIGN